MALLRDVAAGELRLAVPHLFIYEVVRTVRRKAGDASARAVVAFFASAGIIPVPPDERMLAAALDESKRLGCDFYDACAPAVATLLAASLYSADRKAHSRYPDVTLLG
ncbi:MAG: hypothetical protein FD171_2243 [Actinobacteria bacterium]|nr:MAG: hypothetical protein FD171_2243 [Actinomycetota bacterium]